MNKRKPTFYTKSSQAIVFFCILAITIFVSSCSQELFEEQLEQQSRIKVTEKPFSELEKDKKFNQLMRNLTGIQQVSRSAFENQNGFTIAAAPVKVITTDSVTSYTMLVERDVVTDTISFENLVIQENSLGIQKAKILKYTPTIIELSGHNSFYFEGYIQMKRLAFTGFNKRSSNSNTTQAECYTYVDQLWCSQPYNGSTSHHLAGPGCKIGTLYVKKVLVPDDCGSTGGGGDNSSGGSNYDGGFGDTGGGGGGANDNPSEDNNEIITTPVLTIDNPKLKDPCSELNNLTLDTNIKNAILNLQTKTNLTSEYGYSISKNSTGTYNNPEECNASINDPNVINMKIGGNFVGALHTHPLASTTDVVPMFSDGDLNWLYWVAIQNQASSQEKIEFFLTLTVPQGTFAIKIKDWTKFMNFRNNDEWINFDNGKKGKLKILTDKYDDLGPTSNFNSITNAFLEVLRDSNSGIGLYEASADLTSWSELTLAPNSAANTTTSPIKKPCLN